MAWTDISHDAEWLKEPDTAETHRDLMRRVINLHKRRDPECDRSARMWLDRANEKWKECRRESL